MAIWEVTIRGMNVQCEPGDEDDSWEPYLIEETHLIMAEGNDLVCVLMDVQQLIDSLNIRIASKVHKDQPFDEGKKFKIIGIVKTDLKRADGKWMDEMIVNCDFSKEQCKWI